MFKNILIITLILLLISFLFIKKQSNLINTMTEQIPKTISFVDKTPPPPPDVSRVVKKKNYITINGNSNVITYEFNRTLNNVQNIELISAIIPKTNYRINDTNNLLNININGTVYYVELTKGSYENISEILLEINTKIYVSLVSIHYPTNYLLIVFDNVLKTIVFMTDITVSVSFIFSENTCSRILGIDKNSIVELNNTTPPQINDFLDTSIYYLTVLYDSGDPVNNLPDTYYTTLNYFPAPGTDYSVGWVFATSTERVNISHQLYMDVEIDNITYWDGNNILQKIFIDETTSVTHYTRQYPTYRTLSENTLKLDKITLRFFSIIDNQKIPYEFNGIDYSLQLEIVTKNKELNILK